MKTTSSLFQNITKSEMSNLTMQVKETLATGINQEKNFSAAELWNIQRQRKAVRRRYA